jgi:hypothetical protein
MCAYRLTLKTWVRAPAVVFAAMMLIVSTPTRASGAPPAENDSPTGTAVNVEPPSSLPFGKISERFATSPNPLSPPAASLRFPGSNEDDLPKLPSTRTTGSKNETRQAMTTFEFLLSLIVLFFGLVAFMFEFLLLRRRQNLRSEELLRVVAVSMIIVGTLLAITAGFSSEAIAPAMGLFGTMAGYLLGRADRKESEASPGDAPMK